MSMYRREDLTTDASYAPLLPRLPTSVLGRSATVLDIYTEEHTPVAMSEARRLAQLGEWAAGQEDTTPSQHLRTAQPYFGSEMLNQSGSDDHMMAPRAPSRPPPAPPPRNRNTIPTGSRSAPPPPPARTTGRSAVPPALVRTSTVSKADALLPEMANDPYYYPGLVPPRHERERSSSFDDPEFRKPMPRWVWHLAAGAGLFAAGLAVATFRGGHETSTSPIQTTIATETKPVETPTPAEPESTTAPADPAAPSTTDNAYATPGAQAAPAAPLSARELAKQRRAEKRAARLARMAGRKERSGKRGSSSASLFGGSFASAPKASPMPKMSAAPKASPAAASGGGGKMGTLQINSRPWADIYVDNKLVGHTPQMGLPLSAGKHTIKLTNPAMGLTKTLSVTIRAGETVKKIETLGG